MDYLHVGRRDDLDLLYYEIRVNIIRVNNRFCAKHCEEDGRYGLAFFDLFIEPTVDISEIFLLALEVEGAQEALEDASKEVHLEELLEIARRLKEAMKKL